MSYQKSVFINCPFDKKYEDNLRELVFTIISLGYVPRLAIESSDSGTVRFNKIVDLIKKSSISIHDLSRIKSETVAEFFRMNMPFELGIDFGCREYSGKIEHNNKKYLILGEKKYEYMKALSDISGMDIKYYTPNVKIIAVTRDWFVENITRDFDTPSPNMIWNKFMDYNSYYLEFAKSRGYSDKEIFKMPLIEQINTIKRFLISNPYAKKI
ncbi:hypothetical protein [Psychrilyobacter atlanticus]|uniref:hypothetical protein n=1 Tax=Psychrilyobacter atlanticus TaxID=271091 RepID=UPI00048FF899|nr:hypothetical protein [Psychrilyobacter atlanticus]